MNKESLSKIKNNIAKQLTRTIQVDRKLNLNVGDIYDNRGKVESWSDEYSTRGFLVESEDIYEYVFYAYNVPCYKVDYENEEVCEALSCEGCEDESECLVSSDTKFRIIDVAKDSDYDEMGYYAVELELIK